MKRNSPSIGVGNKEIERADGLDPENLRMYGNIKLFQSNRVTHGCQNPQTLPFQSGTEQTDISFQI
jgi:hypothetical protein